MLTSGSAESQHANSLAMAKRASKKKWHDESRAADPLGYRAYMNAKQREYRARKIAEDEMAWRTKERAYQTKARRERLARDPEGCRLKWSDATRKYKYGVSRADYDALRERAGYRCEVCRRHEDDMPKRKHLGISLHLDHDHATKRPRGVLCFHCNAMLGHVDDRIDLLESAIAYLKAH